MSAIQDFLAKLQAQHYGPKDSVIASSLMHPQEGLSKLQEWLQQNVQQAANAPLLPYGNLLQAEEATKAGINLAGLMQTSAFPFAPTGAGIVGTIRPSKLKATLEKLKKEGYDIADPQYHGGPNAIGSIYNTPAFFSNKDYASLMAEMRSDNWPKNAWLNKVALKKDTFLDFTSKNGEADLISLARKAGVDVETDSTGLFKKAAEIIKYYPETGSDNVNHLLYIPKVQKEITKQGFKGAKVLDDFMENYTPTYIAFDNNIIAPLKQSKLLNAELKNIGPLSKRYKLKDFVKK